METTALLLRVTNSLTTGPITVAGFAATVNWVPTRDEPADLPLIGHTLPSYDPPTLVVTGAALGTVFYLVVVAAYTGSVPVVP